MYTLLDVGCDLHGHGEMSHAGSTSMGYNCEKRCMYVQRCFFLKEGITLKLKLLKIFSVLTKALHTRIFGIWEIIKNESAKTQFGHY